MFPVVLIPTHSNTLKLQELRVEQLSQGGVGLKGTGSRQQLEKQQMVPSSCQVHQHLAIPS